MESLHIKEENKSPSIIMDPEMGMFEIKGRSFPENPGDFYQPLLDWLDQYTNSPNPETKFAFRFTYHNSASHKIVHDILMRLKTIQEGGAKVLVHWEYAEGDEDILSEGVEFAANTSLPFDYVMIPS